MSGDKLILAVFVFMATIVSKNKKPEKVKLPSMAAFLNFLMPGLGYLYVWGIKFHRKSLFAIILLIIQGLLFSPYLPWEATHWGDPALLPINVIFAYDAYRDAKKWTFL